MRRSVRPEIPAAGQESVWAYPRPPRLVRSDREVVVRAGDQVVARTGEAWRVLETSHPPTWYLPRSSVLESALSPSARASTTCEWKGAATYWDVLGPDGRHDGAAWSYQRPTAGFRPITGHLAFLATEFQCTVDGELVRPQPGGFYGGWITDDVVGPFKGIPGSWGW